PLRQTGATAFRLENADVRNLTSREIEFRLTKNWWISWAILGSITLVTGAVALILSNDGFGTWQDLAKCFFWGLGLATAGQQMQLLTAGATAQTLKIQLP